MLNTLLPLRERKGEGRQTDHERRIREAEERDRQESRRPLLDPTPLIPIFSPPRLDSAQPQPTHLCIRRHGGPR